MTGYCFRPPSEEKARKWAATLQAASIPAQLRRDRDGRSLIRVPARYLDTATAELAGYETVNCNWPPRPADTGRRPSQPVKTDRRSETIPVIATGLLLPLWHLILSWQGRQEAFRQLGAATRRPMLEQAEWWRAITALTLHADGAHVAGNTIWGMLLGSALAAQTGGGGALLLGLLAGLGGNLMATMLGPASRSAIGASTAVLGLVGLLAGLRFLQGKMVFTPFSEPGIFMRRGWPALLAGLAGLAFLGSAQHTDLSGHLAGFASGILLAPLALYCNRKPGHQNMQWLMTSLFILLLAVSWFLAISLGM